MSLEAQHLLPLLTMSCDTDLEIQQDVIENKVRLNKRGILCNQYSYKFHFFISTSISTVQQNSIIMDYYQIAHVKSFTI